MIDYCFDILMLKQIYCLIDVLNTDSLKLFKKVGFEQCGYRKEWIRTPQGFIDEIEFQLINQNF
jgi:diamine N-acetyltransferase